MQCRVSSSFFFHYNVYFCFLLVPDKAKDSEHPGSYSALKPLNLQPGLNSSRGIIPHPVPSLVPSHLGKHHAAASGGTQAALAATMMTQRSSDSAWFSRQRLQERDSLMELSLRSPTKGTDVLRRDNHR